MVMKAAGLQDNFRQLRPHLLCKSGENFMKILLIGNKVIPEYQMAGILQESSIQAQILSCTQYDTAEEVVQKLSIDLVYAYADFSNDLPALKNLLRQLKDVNPNLYCMLMIYPQDFGEVDDSLQEVVDDFIGIPLESSEFSVRLRKAIQRVEAQIRSREQNKLIAADLPHDEYQHGLAADTFAKPDNNEDDDIYNRRPNRSAIPPNPLGFSQDEKRELYKTLLQGGSAHDEQAGGLRRVVNILGMIFLGLLLLVIVILVVFIVQTGTAGRVPTIFGYQISVCLSNSMRPTIEQGSLIFTRYINPEEVREDDIIIFRDNSDVTAYTIHRVTMVNQAAGLSYTTKGDANETDDPVPVPAEMVIGKFHAALPYAGYLFSFAQSILGMVLIYAAAILFIFNGLRGVFKLLLGNPSRAGSQT
jgi:signal peptidase